MRGRHTSTPARSGPEGVVMSAHRSIVVGVDGSDASLEAVVWGAREAALRNAVLSRVTTVPGRGFAGIPVGMPAAFFEQEEADGRRRLDEAVKYAQNTTWAPEMDTHLCTGPPASELVERSTSAIMVVVGAGRHNALERALLGSVSAAVVTHAHCPVVVVRDLPYLPVLDITGPVVVGVDGSEHSQRAVAVAFEEASLRGVDLLAVHVWSDIEIPIPFHRLESGDTGVQERVVLAESLAGYAEQYPDVYVRSVVAMDRPTRRLREYANGAQLLVVGSRGRGGFTGMLLGSTSRALLHSVSCPMMVAR